MEGTNDFANPAILRFPLSCITITTPPSSFRLSGRNCCRRRAHFFALSARFLGLQGLCFIFGVRSLSPPTAGLQCEDAGKCDAADEVRGGEVEDLRLERGWDAAARLHRGDGGEAFGEVCGCQKRRDLNAVFAQEWLRAGRTGEDFVDVDGHGRAVQNYAPLRGSRVSA